MRFEDLLKAEGIEHRSEGDHHCRSGWIQMRCPHCSSGIGGSFHLGYNIARHSLNCWRCGGHSVAHTLALLTSKPKRYFTELLGDLESVVKTDTVKKSGKLKIPRNVGPLLRCHRDYLRSRGLNPKDVESLWHIGGIGMSSELAWRLFIPVHYRGSVVSWTTRSVAPNAKLRYRAADEADEAIPHRHLLYGEDYCGHSIIVHEGPIDAWTTGPGAVATFGTGFTRQQILRISRYQRRIICYDNEPQAQKQAQKLCDALEVFPGETMNVVLDAKDANEESRKNIRSLRKLLKG